MQIFILDENIEKNVQYYCDKHIIKILTEICQIMCTIYQKNTIYKNLPKFIYKSTHEKHPCVLWGSESLENFKYCINLAEAIYNEYQYRYNRPDKHSKAITIINYLKKYYITIPFKKYNLTSFVQVMPEKYKKLNPIKAYRDYYINEKSHLFKWTKRNKPYWI